MKFSILIPVIKGVFLEKAIESVIGQTEKDWEMIIYNDYSPDNIDTIVAGFADVRIKYIKGKRNLGAKDPSRVWNKMLKLAKGEYFLILGDDDYISENFLEEVNKLIDKYPKNKIFRTRIKRVDEEGKVIAYGRVLPEVESWDEMMYQRNVLNQLQSTCEVVIKRKDFMRMGGYVSFPRACGSDDAAYLMMSQRGGIISTNKATGYWRKSKYNISDNDSLEMNKYKIKFLIDWERDFLDKVIGLKVSARQLYKAIREEDKMSKVEIGYYKNQLDLITVEMKAKNAEIEKIYKSKGWRILSNIYRLKEVTEKYGGNLWKNMEFILRLAKRLVMIFRAEYPAVIYRLKHLNFNKPRREFNRISRKLLFVGHSYHQKTKSTLEFIRYLESNFVVERVNDESWNGGEGPDLSYVDDSYLGVVFFQSLPSEKNLSVIKNNNIVLIPMYDQDGWRDFYFWQKYKSTKILNFSKTLDNKLRRWGFETMYLQYFVKPGKFVEGNKDEIFFWQRVTKINIQTLERLLDNNKYKVHIHKAVDPGNIFIEPSEEEAERYSITYSEWFKTREEMQKVMKDKAIYMAPREYEGIGMSFLEAMSMGKAVLAINNPTMSEYIIDGINGYLYDYEHPKKVDFSRIEEVQKSAYEFIKAGYKQYVKERVKVIDFIKR